MANEDSAAKQAMERAAEGASAQLPLFVDFTSDLVRNVLETVIDSTVDQLEAYADLVAQVSGTLADYQARTLGAPPADAAKGYINDVVIQLFGKHKDTPVKWSAESPTPAEIEFDAATLDELKANFAGVLAPTAASTSPGTFDKALLEPTATTSTSMKTADLKAFAQAKLERDTEASYRTLITLLKLGLQKIVMTDCTIRTSITFHVDSQDTSERTSSQQAIDYSAKSLSWGVNAALSGSRTQRGKLAGNLVARSLGGSISGGASGSRVSSNLKVNLMNERKTSVLNTSIDITGFVELKFKSDYFPSIDPSAQPAPV